MVTGNFLSFLDLGGQFVRVLQKCLEICAAAAPQIIKRLQNILQGDGSRISRETVSNYLSYLQESYITFGISNFSNAVSERESIRKHYFFDNGILNLFLFQPETKLLENLVAIFLYKKYGDRLHYYNRNVEVDFYIPEEKCAIQACVTLNEADTRDREVNALMKLDQLENLNRMVIVTQDEEEVITTPGGKMVEIMPVWKWLLAK